MDPDALPRWCMVCGLAPVDPDSSMYCSECWEMNLGPGDCPDAVYCNSSDCDC